MELMGRKINRISAVLILELIILNVLMLRCFGGCVRYTLDKDSFQKTYKGDFVYFEDGSVGLQEQSLEKTEIMNCLLNLGSGAYQVKIVYDSDTGQGSRSIDNSAGSVTFQTDISSVLKASEIQLKDGLLETESRIWLRQGSGTNLVKLSVWYNGDGKLSVKNIIIEEKREYRVAMCIAAAVLLLICNLLYVVFVRKGEGALIEKRRMITAGIIGITFFSSITYFADFINFGHDLSFHLSRIISLAEGLAEWQIPNRMQFQMVNGYGYATPLYYGEIFLLLPALLYNLYLPVQTCYQIYVVCVNLTTCIVGFWCFSRMARDWKKGLFCGFLYTVSAYRMTCLLLRAAVGEYTAMVFFPLLIYGFWNIYTKAAEEKICIKDYLPIVLSATGIINSHTLSCEIVIVFAAFFMLLCYRKTLQKNVMAALVKSSVLTVLLNLWFIIPFLQSMSMSVNVVNSENVYQIEKASVYLSQLFGVFHPVVGASTTGRKGEMPLAIGLPLVLGIVLFFIVCIKRDTWKLYKDEKMRSAGICALLGFCAIFLASNLFRSDDLIKVSIVLARLTGVIQFPWRYLGIAAVMFTVMILFLLQVIENRVSRKTYRIAAVIIATSAVLSEGFFIMGFTDNQSERKVYSRTELGTMEIGTGREYLLEGTSYEACKNRDIFIEDGIQGVNFYYDKNGVYYLSCINTNEDFSFVDVPVQMYDNYHAYQSDGSEIVLAKGENNRVRMSLPAKFDGTVCLKYQVPALWRISEVISCMSACFIALLLQRKKPVWQLLIKQR